MVVFPKTARKASKLKTKPVFAFGRRDDLVGKPNSEGGFVVFKLAVNHDSTQRGQLSKRWVCVAKDLSHDAAVQLMNKRLHRKEWLLETEKEDC